MAAFIKVHGHRTGRVYLLNVDRIIMTGYDDRSSDAVKIVYWPVKPTLEHDIVVRETAEEIYNLIEEANRRSSSVI